MKADTDVQSVFAESTQDLSGEVPLEEHNGLSTCLTTASKR